VRPAAENLGQLQRRRPRGRTKRRRTLHNMVRCFFDTKSQAHRLHAARLIGREAREFLSVISRSP
jgi:hypothetical protein